MRRPMRFDVITLFPELFAPFLASGVTRRAYESKQVEVVLWNPRDFAEGNYRRVDDRPFGGGPGMVMMAEPLSACLDAALAAARRGGAGRPVLADRRDPAAMQTVEALVGRRGRGAGVRALRRRRPALHRCAGHAPARAWATSCFPAARFRPWRCWTPSRGCSPACWATRTATRRTASIRRWTACWTARTTRGPEQWKGRACRLCCSRATTRRSSAGGATSGSRSLLQRRPELIDAARAAGRLDQADEKALPEKAIIIGFPDPLPAASPRAPSRPSRRLLCSASTIESRKP